MGLSFKDVIDINLWRPNSPAPAATGAGQSLISDLRNDITKDPYLFLLRSATVLDCYDPTTDEWLSLISPALAGTFGAGAQGVYHPSQGPRGVLAAGSTTGKVILSTALPAAVGVNQLANRGDGVGFKIRINGNAGGSSGKVEERIIVANTAGTTPTIWVDAPFVSTFIAGDAYEIHSGRIFFLNAGTLAAGMWKYYDRACNVMSGNLATASLPATVAGDSDLVALSEEYVPNSRKIGEGYIVGTGSYDGASKLCLTATAIAAGTITGQATGGDAGVLVNQYRNFCQIRIVEDTVNVTAVGQRRRIVSHTVGPSAVYTLASNWTVTPSENCKFVIENFDDYIILMTTQAAVFNYDITGNVWSTAIWAAAAAAGAAGITIAHCWGIDPDVNVNVGQGCIYRIRGGGVATIDVFDMTNGVTGTWSADIAYGHKGLTLFTTGTSGIYDPATLGGRLLHLDVNGTQRGARFDMKNRVLDAETYIRMTQGAAVVGRKMGLALAIDGTTKIGFVYKLLHTLPNLYSLAATR